MIDENAWARLARYVASECSPEEAEEVRRWIEADPSRREALAFMEQVNASAGAARPRWDTDASWMRVAARKSARARRPRIFARSSDDAVTAPWRRHAARAAAAAALVAGGSLLWTWEGRRAESVVAPAVTREYVTPRGQRATFNLPDGSSVMLGVASRLRYSAVPARSGARDLGLDGEALFTVKHDETRPFVVRTAHGVTRDLGTMFSMQSYPTDTALRVVVAEGSVELRSHRLPAADRGAVLTAGQLGQLGKGGEVLVRSGIDLARHMAWTEGRLVFDDTPFRDVLTQLGRWYDLDFELSDPALGGRRLTASISGEAIGPTLDLLASSLDLRYKRRGRAVAFSAASQVP